MRQRNERAGSLFRFFGDRPVRHVLGADWICGNIPLPRLSNLLKFFNVPTDYLLNNEPYFIKSQEGIYPEDLELLLKIKKRLRLSGILSNRRSRPARPRSRRNGRFTRGTYSLDLFLFEFGHAGKNSPSMDKGW